MSSDLTMKNAIHSHIMPKGAYDSAKGDNRRQQTMQERRDMIKYYKNYKRGDRDINTKINSENLEKQEAEEDNEGKPSVIPVDDDLEDMADIGDENEAMQGHGGRFHTEVQEMNDANKESFVQSEEDDGVDGLPEEQSE